MPRGSKEAYTDKQKRQAEHIEEGYEEKGVSQDEAERRAWATVNKQDGGGKKSGSARKSARKGTKTKKAKTTRAKTSGRKKTGRKKPGPKPKRRTPEKKRTTRKTRKKGK
jgi:plasmid stabilization system protein ParE